MNSVPNVGGALRAANHPIPTPRPGSDLRHSHSLRTYRRYDGPGCWFVTKCLQPRRPLLDSQAAERVADALKWYAAQGDICAGAFVIMPDHWHLLFHTGPCGQVKTFMRKACHWISRETRDSLVLKNGAWQDGYHDTRVRSVRQFRFIRHYIEENPVRKGLVSRASDWEWSSAHAALQSNLSLEWSRLLPE